MLARLRRTHAPPPGIHEPPPPPPPAAARREKEHRWLRSIGRSGAGERQAQSRTEGEGDGRVAGASRLPAPSIRSSRSTGSFRLFGGTRTGAGREGGGTAGEVAAAQAHSAKGKPSPAAPSSRPSSSPRRGLYPSRAPHPGSSSSSSFASADARLSPQAQPVTLAQRLQELAVANADGLLDEDEYRILRGQLFESSAAAAASASGTGGGAAWPDLQRLSEGTLAVPSLRRLEREAKRASSNFTATGPVASPLTSEDAEHVAPGTSSTARPLLAPPESRPAPSIASTTRSKRSSVLKGLFRRPSASSVRGSPAEPLGEGWTHVASPSLSSSTPSPVLADSVSVISRGASSRRSSHSRDASLQSPPLAGGATTTRTRSIRHHPGLGSSAFSTSPRLRAGGSSPEVLRTGSVSARSVGSSVTTRTSPASPAPGTFSISPSSHAAYGPSSSAHYPSAAAALPALPSARDPAALATRDLSAHELRVELAEIEAEWGRVRGAWEGVVRGEVARWEGVVGGEVARGLAGRSRREGEANGGAPRGGEDASGAARATSSPSSPATLPIPSGDLPPTLPDDIALATLALRRRVRELQDRRAATDDRYARRVDFLRARLRAAEIRERLR